MKKNASGTNYKIEFELGPGQQLGWILPAGASFTIDVKGINWLKKGIWDMEIEQKKREKKEIADLLKEIKNMPKPDPNKGWK